MFIQLKNKTTITLVGVITAILLLSCLVFMRSNNEVESNHSASISQPLQTHSPSAELGSLPEPQAELKQQKLIKSSIITTGSTNSNNLNDDQLSNQKECLDDAEQAQLEQAINDIGGNRFDLDGNETSEQQHLRLLDQNSLTRLANQGYANAMVLLAERMLWSDNEEQTTAGIEWAKSAAAHGREDALGVLMAHYSFEQQRAQEAGNQELANSLFLKFLSIERLLNHSIPEITQELSQGIFNTSDLSEAQLNELNIQVKQLISEYDQVREKIGLEKQAKTLPDLKDNIAC